MDMSLDRVLGITGVVGIVIGVGVAIAMDPKVKAEMQVAIGCFIFSGTALCVTVGLWAFNTDVSLANRILLTGVLCAAVCVPVVEASRWANGRYVRAIALEHPQQTAPVANNPATLKFTHTALNQYQTIGSQTKTSFVENRPVLVRVTYENISDGAAEDVMPGGTLWLLPYPGKQGERVAAWDQFLTNWRALKNTLPLTLDGHKDDHFDLATLPLSSEQVKEITDEKLMLFFFGAIRWTDNLGKWETTLCSYFRPVVTYSADSPAYWMDVPDCTVTRRAIVVDVPAPPPSPVASIYPEPMPVIDLASNVVHCIVRLTNTGSLPARDYILMANPYVFPSGVTDVDIDHAYMGFEQHAKKQGFGNNTIDAKHSTEFNITMPIPNHDLVAVQAGTKVLYIFVIVKYKDDNNPAGLLSKGCAWHAQGRTMPCNGHNERP